MWKEGLCVGHNIVTDSVTLTVGDKLEKTILKESDVEACQKEWLKPAKWKSMGSEQSSETEYPECMWCSKTLAGRFRSLCS